MPKHEVKCPECGRLELVEVPEGLYCDKYHDIPVPMKRTFSFGGAVLKGSGFYRNDSRSEK